MNALRYFFSTLPIIAIALLCSLISCNQSDSTSTLDNVPPSHFFLTKPFYKYQWHLKNSGQFNGTTGEDIDVEKAWNMGIKGSGVVVAVVDDGVEINHHHLANNIIQEKSFNFLNKGSDPTPLDKYDGHGTCVAGIIAANRSFDKVLSGVAPESKIVAYNLLQSFTSANMVDSLSRNMDSVDVVNNSWGNYDLGYFYESDDLWNETVWNGVNYGRNGRGLIYVWAAGNGAKHGDMALYDPYTSHPGVIAVGSVDNKGAPLYFSEPGANIWVVAPSGGGTSAAISTTDLMGNVRGFNNKDSTDNYSDYDFTNNFNGTSASAPVVSGVVALMFSANPNLSWRDVKYILAKSARKNNLFNNNWKTNGAGIAVNFHLGFGVVNADNALDLAQDWVTLPPMISEEYSLVQNNDNNDVMIIDDKENISTSSIEISNSTITNLEFVELTVDINYSDWGKLNIVVERDAPNLSSTLALPHNCYNTSHNISSCIVSTSQFTFGLAHHLDENPNGVWTLKVFAKEANAGVIGKVNSWKLKIYGH